MEQLIGNILEIEKQKAWGDKEVYIRHTKNHRRLCRCELENKAEKLILEKYHHYNKAVLYKLCHIPMVKLAASLSVSPYYNLHK